MKKLGIAWAIIGVVLVLIEAYLIVMSITGGIK